MAEDDSKKSPAQEADQESAAEASEQLQTAGEHDEEQHPDLQRLLGIPLPVTVELGRVRLTVERLLQLGNGSVIELDKMAGEPAELYVRNTKFAVGEVVVVDDNFGLRITEIIDRETGPDSLPD